MPSFQDRLSRMRAEELDGGAAQRVYEDYVSVLLKTGFLRHALDVGDPFPDFMLPNAEGRMVTLHELVQHGPVVAAFYRGDWCPYCQLLLHALSEAHEEIKSCGASLIALTPDTGGRALAVKREHRAAYDILCDVDCGVGLACGIVFRTPPLYRQELLAGGLDLADWHGNPSWLLPLPATFVIDTKGVIAWRFADIDFTRLSDPDDILDALKKLR